LYISFIYKLLYKNTYVNLSIDNHLKICHNRLFYDTAYNFDLHSAPHTTYVAHPQKIFRSCDFLWRKLGANQLNFRIRCNVKIALFHKKSLITLKFVYEIVYCALIKKFLAKF